MAPHSIQKPPRWSSSSSPYSLFTLYICGWHVSRVQKENTSKEQSVKQHEAPYRQLCLRGVLSYTSTAWHNKTGFLYFYPSTNRTVESPRCQITKANNTIVPDIHPFLHTNDSKTVLCILYNVTVWWHMDLKLKKDLNMLVLCLV